MIKIFFLVFSLIIAPPVHQEGWSTFYSAKERKRDAIRADGEKFEEFEIFMASRNIPLHTFVKVESLDGNKSVCLPVKDRGPYGACSNEKNIPKSQRRGCKTGRWFIKVKRLNPLGLKGKYRGVADLSYGAALKFHGLTHEELKGKRPPNATVRIRYWSRDGKTEENCRNRISRRLVNQLLLDWAVRMVQTVQKLKSFIKGVVR